MPRDDEREADLLSHLKHHRTKDWLRQGCKDEKAHTIGEAVERISKRRLDAALARVLSREH